MHIFSFSSSSVISDSFVDIGCSTTKCRWKLLKWTFLELYCPFSIIILGCVFSEKETAETQLITSELICVSGYRSG